jgi:hypothetical protein
VQADNADCRQWAQQQAWQRAARRELLGWGRGDPLVEEMRLADACLRARGYQLVPAERAARG